MSRTLVLFLCATLLTPALSRAAAAPTQDQLWTLDAQQDQWTPVSLAAPGVSGNVQAWQSPDGQMHIESIGDRFQSALQLTSTQFARYRSQDQFLKTCAATESAYPAYRQTHLPYTAVMQILPFRSQNVNMTAQAAGATSPVSALATQFMPLATFNVHVPLTTDAFLRKSGDVDVTLFERQLLTQVLAQKDQIAQTGHITLDLSGYEDLVCDLLSGKASINVQVYVNYSRAKIQHQTRLTADQMTAIYNQVSSSWVNSTPKSNDRRAARLIYQSVTSQNLTQPFSDDEYDRLQTLVTDDTSNELQCGLPSSQISAIAAKMDHLSLGSAVSFPTFQSVIQSPFAGGQ